MKSRNDILRLLAQGKPRWEEKFKLKKLALFGSYAREDQAKESDIDILVDADPEIGLDFVDLANEIENQLGESIELASQGAIKNRHWKYIEKDLIYV
ncbi:conserved hypothetical protein [Candidatus Desulfarcum epimagneticum]|uniref:Polymerase nucleotidyl transferase domain-containing protein n=1 Tax=uncultured Desulfobacteraceae bacterium TaxID=218296 RepID=A0A484HIY6_9BACT|nr:conserved hypothetical protein [uncultured Desulfobacteraceae bacterium]